MISNEVPYLVLVRHGQSEWNQRNLFTGWKNPPLTKEGEEEAIRAAEKISRLGIHFDMHFTSKLMRAQKTGELILKELDQVAYVRFASVYKNFQAADDFEEFVSELRPDTK